MVPEGTLHLGSWVLPVLACSPPHPAYPSHQHLICHRFRAMGNGTSRWQSALQRSLECPQRGEASSRPGCLSKETLALLPLRWQEAVPWHLLPQGGWALAQRSLLLSVPPCCGGGLALLPLLLWLAVWPSGPFLQNSPLSKQLCRVVMSGEPWKLLLSTQAVAPATDVGGPRYR